MANSVEARVSRIFRLSCAVRWTAAVDDWLAGQPGELGGLALTWFTQLRGCGDDVLELLHDGCPIACIHDVPFAYVNVFKAHVNVGFFAGADLPDPAALLEGSGKRMRHVKLRPPAEIDADALRGLIAAAYQNARAIVANDCR